MMRDLMTTDGYGKLREEAEQREKWWPRTFEPAFEVESRKKSTGRNLDRTPIVILADAVEPKSEVFTLRESC